MSMMSDLVCSHSINIIHKIEHHINAITAHKRIRSPYNPNSTFGIAIMNLSRPIREPSPFG